MSFEIGGFADNENVVDGDWESFNFCVAENYYDAMIGEEFDFLGDASCDFLERIMFWLNYDGEIGKDDIAKIEKIGTGMFMTYRNRTFIDAIVENKNVSFAETYIQFGSSDVRLFAICLFGVEIDIVDGEEIYNGTILNMINKFCEDKKDYIDFFNKLFVILDEEYIKLELESEKIKFLDVVRKNLVKFRYSCSEKINIDEICISGFSRKLLNK